MYDKINKVAILFEKRIKLAEEFEGKLNKLAIPPVNNLNSQCEADPKCTLPATKVYQGPASPQGPKNLCEFHHNNWIATDRN